MEFQHNPMCSFWVSCFKLVSSPFFNVHGGVSFNVPLDAHMFFIFFFFAFQSQKLSLPLPLPFLGYFQKFVPPHFSKCSYATENILFPIHSKYMLAQEKSLIPHWKRCTTISWNPHIPEHSLKTFFTLHTKIVISASRWIYFHANNHQINKDTRGICEIVCEIYIFFISVILNEAFSINL